MRWKMKNGIKSARNEIEPRVCASLYSRPRERRWMVTRAIKTGLHNKNEPFVFQNTVFMRYLLWRNYRCVLHVHFMCFGKWYPPFIWLGACMQYAEKATTTTLTPACWPWIMCALYFFYAFEIIRTGCIEHSAHWKMWMWAQRKKRAFSKNDCKNGT